MQLYFASVSVFFSSTSKLLCKIDRLISQSEHFFTDKAAVRSDAAAELDRLTRYELNKIQSVLSFVKLNPANIFRNQKKSVSNTSSVEGEVVSSSQPASSTDCWLLPPWTAATRTASIMWYSSDPGCPRYLDKCLGYLRGSAISTISTRVLMQSLHNQPVKSSQQNMFPAIDDQSHFRQNLQALLSNDF